VIFALPEFASAKQRKVPGTIDLFLPVSKYGIEITRDGRLLKEHGARFASDGAYGAWLQSSYDRLHPPRFPHRHSTEGYPSRSFIF